MNRTLDYFADFLDDPEVLDDAQYRYFFDEWLVYLKEHQDTLDFLGEEWRERRERLHGQYEKRLSITPEIKNELKEISLQLENIVTLDDNETIAFFQKHLDFLNANKYRFSFAQKDIFDAANRLKKFKEKVVDIRSAEEKLKQAKVEQAKAFDEFEEAMFDEYERTGKMPILNVNVPGKKKRDN